MSRIRHTEDVSPMDSSCAKTRSIAVSALVLSFITSTVLYNLQFPCQHLHRRDGTQWTGSENRRWSNRFTKCLDSNRSCMRCTRGQFKSGFSSSVVMRLDAQVERGKPNPTTLANPLSKVLARATQYTQTALRFSRSMTDQLTTHSPPSLSPTPPS